MHMTHERARMDNQGVTRYHHFYTTRIGAVIARLWTEVNNAPSEDLKRIGRFWIDSHFLNLSIQNCYRPGVTFPYNPISGIYYVSSLISEPNPFIAYENKLKQIERGFAGRLKRRGHFSIMTGSCSSLPIPGDSVDYIFTDPPFGENIYYSDLNFLVEAWTGVLTNASSEAIIDRARKKALPEYQRLMQRSFSEYFRVLKPGRWMTVVFSNSKASVWNAIQVSLQQAGFVVAEVNALDKVQGSYRQVTSTTAVKQDLVISAYKPNGGLEKRLAERGAAPDSAWDFVQTHLRQLPVSKAKSGALEMVVERDPRRIYDRMVAWFVRHDFPVPLSTEEFLEGLRSRFPERDGMVFLPDQVAEYDRKRAQVAQAPQMELFVSDERSAIDWLADFLRRRPSTYQEVHPEFITQVGAGWRKHEEKPELSALLTDNFLRFDGNGEVPSQIHSYLSTNFKDLRGLEKEDSRLKAKAKDRWFVPDPSKSKDLEQKRERSLLKEFESYKSAPGRRLKEFRLEALRAGFKAAWAAKDYKTIVGIAQKIPEEALQEDEKLLLWYDQALTRMEANT
ncbi:site-specific DNA-methyltransferase [Rhizobium phaseoli]|uniref:site-specific DNA-methyltransferase n=1 Tax=Rhizobium phaseoli TaxID=396 RepID=UPI001AECDB87|nr:site-specific DNA-methyltransferase [Rhizobium phaseoli]